MLKKHKHTEVSSTVVCSGKNCGKVHGREVTGYRHPIKMNVLVRMAKGANTAFLLCFGCATFSRTGLTIREYKAMKKRRLLAHSA